MPQRISGLAGSAVDWPTGTPGEVVAGAARAAGAVADAVLRIDRVEHERRAAAGLGAVPALDVLDALMCLPVGVAVPVRDVGEVPLAHVRAAPPGCVEWVQRGSAVRRLAVSPVVVSLVVVRAATWRAGLRNAAAFAPLATRVVYLDALPAGWPGPALEAVAAGVGVWAAGAGGDVMQYVAPAEFRPRRAKAAGWRFAERAYGEWLSATRP